MRFLTHILLLLFLVPGTAQELPPVINFDPNQYEAGNQNWKIAQNFDKHIYVANSMGLLEYDGAKWSLYPMPNNTVVRSVQVLGDRIFTGAYMEVGYWMKNNKGLLEYTSLLPQFPGEVKDGEQFWHMEYIDDVLVFQSFEGLYFYNLNTNSITRVDTSSSLITNLFKVDNNIYFQVMAGGLFKIANNQPQVVIPPQDLRDIEIMHVSNNGPALNLVSRKGNFYEWRGKELIRTKIKFSDLYNNLSVFSAHSFPDNSLLLGTVEQGVFHLDSSGEVLLNINQKNGLANNTVLDLFLDEDNNVWAALDNGLSVINLESPFQLFQDHFGELGSVYASLQTGGYLYVGTNQGLFFKKEGHKNFKFIEGTNGQVWNLQLIDDTVFCGHNNGTYLIKGETAERIYDRSGTWTVESYKGHPGYYLQGHYNGISLLRREKGGFEFVGMVSDFPHSSKFLISEKDGDIWTVNEHKGVFRLQLEFPGTGVKNIENYTFGSVSGINSSIFKFNDTLYYSAREKLFQYREGENSFIDKSSLGRIFEELRLISGKLIKTDNNILWGFSDEAIFHIEIAQLSNSYRSGMIHLSGDLSNVTLGYENITLLKDESYLLGVSNGYLRFRNRNDKPADSKMAIKRIYASALDETPQLISLDESPSFHYKTNNISFEYSIPEYKKFLNPSYSYRLLGLSSNWSAWTENNSAGFENLPYGDYEFQVRAKTGTRELNTVVYNFTIDRPWYLSYLAIVFYILLFFTLLLSINKIYKQKHLRIVREREKELKMKNLESEKRIVELQNEQLERDMTGKNKELAISTMSLIKKNEFLTSIRDRLKRSGESSDIRSVVRTIDKDISEEDNWNFFKEAFNNADKDFFSKIKSGHPDLTSHDLKLCAYLRLNLSSKEIAPLLNISVKSVEIKRYRLRKKMGLSREVNLVDYILEI